MERLTGTDTKSKGFSLSDVDHIELCSVGLKDEYNWLAVGRLVDSRWFYLSAGCDFTGWD